VGHFGIVDTYGLSFLVFEWSIEDHGFKDLFTFSITGDLGHWLSKVCFYAKKFNAPLKRVHLNIGHWP